MTAPQAPGAAAAPAAGALADAATVPRPTAAAWWTLAVLLLLALYMLIDRPLLSLQLEPLRRELALSDFQVGLVQGLSVALFTAVAGYPIGWLADRFDRRVVLAGAVAVWSLSIAWSGLSRSFEELFIASALAGAGEAGLLPIVYVLIPALFKGGHRQLANSTLVVGGRLGMGLVMALCGWMIAGIESWRGLLPETLQSLATWRLSLLVTALPGLLLLPLILWLPVDPRAAALDAHAPTSARRQHPVLPYLRRNASGFACFYLGVGSMVFGIGCVLNFAPAIAIRQMGATPLQAGNGMGAATFSATLAGFVIAYVAYRRLVPHFGVRLQALALLVAAVIGAMLAPLTLLTASPTALFVVVGAYLTVIMAGTLLFPMALQELSPTPMRARLAAVAVTINIVLGSLGPAVVGAVSDQLKTRPDGLLLATAIVSCAAMVVSSALLLPVTMRYRAMVATAREHDTSQD